jgi:hypothetical protein
MNNTAQIDVSLYGCYYVHESLEPFKIYTRHPGGDMEYTGYDTFTADDKTIIAFKDYSVTKTDYNYVLISNEKEFIVQDSTYESLYHQLNQHEVGTTDAYVIFNSVSVPNLKTTDYDPIWSYESRCDTHSYGVTPYQLVDGQTQTHVDRSIFNAGSVKVLFPALSVSGIQCLMYVSVEGLGTSYRDSPSVSRLSKTFMGAMKLIIEWASLADDPFDINEELIVDSRNFLEDLNLGQDIIDEISEYQEDMPVYRYLKNVPNARQGFEEVTTISPLFSAWLRKNLRYVSLNSLVAQYPEEINIDANILEEEKTSIEEKVYIYCTMLQIDDEVVTPEEALKIVEYPNIYNSEKLSRSDTFKARKSILSYMSYK